MTTPTVPACPTRLAKWTWTGKPMAAPTPSDELRDSEYGSDFVNRHQSSPDHGQESRVARKDYSNMQTKERRPKRTKPIKDSGPCCLAPEPFLSALDDPSTFHQSLIVKYAASAEKLCYDHCQVLTKLMTEMLVAQIATVEQVEPAFLDPADHVVSRRRSPSISSPDEPLSQKRPSTGSPQTHGEKNDEITRRILQKAKPPEADEALFLNGEEAKSRAEGDWPPDIPIFTTDQQQFQWTGTDRPIVEFLGLIEDIGQSVSVQIPSISATSPSYQLRAFKEVRALFLDRKATKVPWNLLDFRSPLPHSILPKFLSGRNCLLLSRIQDVLLQQQGGSAERTVASTSEWTTTHHRIPMASVPPGLPPRNNRLTKNEQLGWPIRNTTSMANGDISS